MKKLIFLILLSSCAVGPNYKKPQTSMPLKYAEQDLSTNEIESLKNWWETLEDPILNEMIQTAITNNYSLKIALEKIEETRAQYRIKRADLFPEIDLNAQACRTKISRNLILSSFYPVTIYNYFQVGFDAIWEVDIFGRLRREKEAAYAQFEQSIENMRDVYITLISDVARYYVDICTVQNIIDLTNKKIDLQKEIYRLTSNLNSNGLESKILEEDRLANLKEEEEALKFYTTYLKDSAYNLAVLLGQEPETILKRLDQYTNVPIAIDKIKVGVPSTLLRRRPDIRAAERALAASTAKVGAAIARYFPTFSITGDSFLAADQLNNLFKNNSFAWNIGSFLNWPIITFGRLRANVDMMKSNEKQSLYNYENTVLNALKDVESALAAYYNEEKKLIEIQDEVTAYSKMSILEQNKYQNGLNNLSSYYEIEKIYIASSIKELESKRALCHDLIALYKALGGSDW